MTNLKKCDISKMDASNIANMNLAFCLAVSLSECDLPVFSDALETMNDMFTYCNSLRMIDLSGSDLSGIKHMYHFANHAGVVEIAFPQDKPIHIARTTGIDGCFQNCSLLERVTGISNWDLSDATSIGCIFAHCSSLETVDCSDWDTGNVEDFSSVFLDCTNLTELNLSKWNLSSAVTMRNMFASCESLREIVGISEFDVGSVDDMSNIFYKCKNLDSLDVRSFAVFSADNGSLNFYHRIGMPEVGDEFDGAIVDAVYTNFENARYRPAHDESDSRMLYWTDNAPWFDKANNVFSVEVVDYGITPLRCDCWLMMMRNVSTIDISRLDTTKLTGFFATFGRCENLINLRLPENINNITDMNDAFYACGSLECIDLSDFDSITPRGFYCCFTGCASL